MATPYEKIYNRFSQKITDFNLAEVNDDFLIETLQGWLNSSIVRIRKCEHDLSLRDDEIQEFSDSLSDLEIELLALGMVDAWISQYINSTENVLKMIGGKEEKWFSEANHLTELRETRMSNLSEMQKLHNYYTYTNNSYFDN